MAETDMTAAVLRPDVWEKRNTARFTTSGHEWHRHEFAHTHPGGDAEHHHGEVLVADAFVERLTGLLRQTSVAGAEVSAETAKEATQLLRELAHLDRF